mmetsp:Transcript_29327/g.74339  ORF Transcript_29327/g.74339 Transcript_29327/m.74339 type:complete len:203 (+) Transcript_29327:750-1358(+)
MARPSLMLTRMLRLFSLPEAVRPAGASGSEQNVSTVALLAPSTARPPEGVEGRSRSMTEDRLWGESMVLPRRDVGVAEVEDTCANIDFLRGRGSCVSPLPVSGSRSSKPHALAHLGGKSPSVEMERARRASFCVARGIIAWSMGGRRLGRCEGAASARGGPWGDKAASPAGSTDVSIPSTSAQGPEPPRTRSMRLAPAAPAS